MSRLFHLKGKLAAARRRKRRQVIDRYAVKRNVFKLVFRKRKLLQQVESCPRLRGKVINARHTLDFNRDILLRPRLEQKIYTLIVYDRLLRLFALVTVSKPLAFIRLEYVGLNWSE